MFPQEKIKENKDSSSATQTDCLNQMNAPKSSAPALEITTGKAFPVYTDKKSSDKETWSKEEISINAGEKWNALHKLLELDKNLQDDSIKHI